MIVVRDGLLPWVIAVVREWVFPWMVAVVRDGLFPWMAAVVRDGVFPWMVAVVRDGLFPWVVSVFCYWAWTLPMDVHFLREWRIVIILLPSQGLTVSNSWVSNLHFQLFWFLFVFCYWNTEACHCSDYSLSLGMPFFIKVLSLEWNSKAHCWTSGRNPICYYWPLNIQPTAFLSFAI